MMRITIDIPDDHALLVDEYRKGQSREAWVLDAVERKIQLLRDGVVLRRPEEVDVETELAMIESRKKGTVAFHAHGPVSFHSDWHDDGWV
jgi:hypothetical protein